MKEKKGREEEWNEGRKERKKEGRKGTECQRIDRMQEEE